MIAVETAELKPSLALTDSIDSLGVSPDLGQSAHSKGFSLWQSFDRLPNISLTFLLRCNRNTH